NGKLDRNALPAPTSDTTKAAIPAAQERVPPSSLAEEAVAQVWSEVLEVTEFGVHDDFFESGGHSLLALRLIARLRDNLQIELPIRSIFQNPTIAGLATIVEQALLDDIEASGEGQVTTAGEPERG